MDTSTRTRRQATVVIGFVAVVALLTGAVATALAGPVATPLTGAVAVTEPTAATAGSDPGVRLGVSAETHRMKPGISEATHRKTVGRTVGFGDGNSPPRADAGLDQTVPVGTVVYLDGSGSLDPDGSITGYEWRITTPTVNTADPVDATAARTRFTPTERGRYRVTLVVTDDDSVTRRDTAYVTVVARETATPASTTTATRPVGRTPTAAERTPTATPARGGTPTEQHSPTATPNLPPLTATPTPASTATPTPASTATPTPDPFDSTLPYPGSGSSLSPIGGLAPDGSGGTVVPGPGDDDSDG